MFCIRDSAGKKIYFIYKSQLPDMSDRRKPIIALTGATGFLGSHLMASMLIKGHSIIVFGRSAKNESLRERISRLLHWFGINNSSDQVSCIDADLSQDNLGIANEEYSCMRKAKLLLKISFLCFARKTQLIFLS